MSVYRLMCLAGVLLALAGCRKKEAPLEPGDLAPNAVVVKVDGVPLTFRDMARRADGYLKYAIEREHIAFAPSKLPEAKAFYRQRAISMFVYKALMLNEAERLGITASEKEYAAWLQALEQTLQQRQSSTNRYFNGGPQPPDIMLQDFRDERLIDKMLSQEAPKRFRVMDDEVEAMAKEIEETNLIRRAKLEAARKQILDGADFADVARAISEDTPSAKRGGDLGEFARGKANDAAFDAAVFSLPLDQVSDVVETRFGYHLFKVSAKNPAQPEKDDAPAVPETVRAAHILVKMLSTSRPKLADVLYKQKSAQSGRTLYDELKGKAKIENTLFPDMEYQYISDMK